MVRSLNPGGTRSHLIRVGLIDVTVSGTRVYSRVRLRHPPVPKPPVICGCPCRRGVHCRHKNLRFDRCTTEYHRRRRGSVSAARRRWEVHLRGMGREEGSRTARKSPKSSEELFGNGPPPVPDPGPSHDLSLTKVDLYGRGKRVSVGLTKEVGCGVATLVKVYSFTLF